MMLKNKEYEKIISQRGKKKVKRRKKKISKSNLIKQKIIKIKIEIKNDF